MSKKIGTDINTFIEDQFVYRQLIEGLPIATYGCDENGRITFFNRAAMELWGREAAIGKDQWCGSWKLFNPDGNYLSHEVSPMAITLKEGRSVTGNEIIIERPDGTRLNVMSHPRPIFNDAGLVVGAVNTLVDITKQKKDTHTLSELERSNNELASFSYIASHDLQEPLRKIITFSHKLKDKLEEQAPEGDQEYLEKIISSTKRMRRLIEDILNFSHISNSAKKFENVDLNLIAQTIIADFEHQILEKKAKIKIDRLPVVEAIPLQMSQLFHNLFSNALKFSSESIPEITITSEILAKKEVERYLIADNYDRIYVKLSFVDNGIGFKQEYAENIFSMFQRLHGQAKYSGTGIGLALCRKIAENHSGVIFAESTEESGSEFHVVFPSTQKN